MLTKEDFNQDEFTMIRGHPRDRKAVEFVEKTMGGRLVRDEEAALMLQLDHYLFDARKKLGHYPDFIQIPSEPFAYFCPVPFDINFYGVTIKSWQKPAWFRTNKTVNVPWSNK